MRLGRAAGLPAALGATLALVGVTAVWGATFVVVKHAVTRMAVSDFLFWRFGLATVAMLGVRPAAVRGLSRAGVRAGLVLGAALAAGYLTQTFGLQRLPASVSGFVTGMFVVLTPLVARLVLRRRVGAAGWAAAGVAAAGLALLSSVHRVGLGAGELLTLACALAFAVHIVGLGEWAHRHDSAGLAVLQLGSVTVVCAVAAAPSGLAPPPDAGVWVAVVLTGLLATALAFFVQTWAQARLSPTRAAVVLTMEPVFAGVFGVALGGDRLGATRLAGAALVLAAMLLVELGPARGPDPAIERLEV